MPRFFRFSYHAPKEEDRQLRPHQVRDGAAFAELTARLYSNGYDYGGLLLNYPADDLQQTVQIDTSFLRPDDLLVLTTRPPLDDEKHRDHKQLKRSHTSLEEQIFETLRRYFEICARSHIRLSRLVAEQLGNFANRADIEFFQKADALSSYKSYKS